ncbi:hypothetical protein P7C70_g6809, partial [Phenoliferia sp. Uapishka_3]
MPSTSLKRTTPSSTSTTDLKASIKRVKKTPVTEDADSESEEYQQTPMSVLKELFSGLKEQVDAIEKWQGKLQTMKVSKALDPAQFSEIFSGKGTLKQPTPTNNPKSAVTMISFNPDQTIELFGNRWKNNALKGVEWSVGGPYPGTPFPFTLKSVQGHAVPVVVKSMEASYSKKTKKVTLKFECTAGQRYRILHNGRKMMIKD